MILLLLMKEGHMKGRTGLPLTHPSGPQAAGQAMQPFPVSFTEVNLPVWVQSSISTQTDRWVLGSGYGLFEAFFGPHESHFCCTRVRAKLMFLFYFSLFLFIWKNFLNSAFGLSWGTECKMMMREKLIYFILTWGLTVRNSENPWEWLPVAAIATMGRTQVSPVLVRLGHPLLVLHCSLFSSCELRLWV